MAVTGFSTLLACSLLASTMLMTVLGAPPQPPSISAAISPHPQQPQSPQGTIQHLQHRLSQEDFNNDGPHSNSKRPFVKETLAKRNFLKQRQHEDDLLESNDIDDQTSDEMRMPLLSSDLYDSDDNPNVEQNEETEPAPGSRLDEDDVETDSNEDLGPALRELARRKRNPKTTSEARPYSASRTRSPSRYRYPLHRKRSSRIPQQHSFSRDDPNDSLFALYDDYPDSDVIYGPGMMMMAHGPSLFRERAFAPEPAREMFLEDPLPLSMLQAEGPAMEEKRQFTPLRKSLYDVGVHDETYGGEESNEAQGEIPLELLKNTLDFMQRRTLEDEIRENQLRNEESELLEELVNKAAEEYYRENRPLDRYDLSNAMIRRKRSVHPPAAAIHDSKSSKYNTTNTTAIKIKTPERVTVAEYRAELAADRKKRAFGTSALYDRRKKNYSHMAHSKKRSQEELDDFLTREYFKDIARSVGNKKKRMTYGKFEADKRSNSIDAFLDNPEMLQYMMDKLKEAENSVAEEAEADMASDASRGGGSEGSLLFRNAIVRLDALERMRESLEQLKMLQQQEEGSNDEGERRKKKKKSSLPETHLHLLQQHSVHPLLQHLQYLECPPLQRVLSTCAAVSSVAGDAEEVFVPACVRHEVCYMCGAGLGVTRHECDALLSSALEAPCEGALNCLGAAGETFALLSDGRRYSEDAGSCVHQACVRSILESRR